MNILILPSYLGHLDRVFNFFNSIEINCLDKKDTIIYLIISEYEKKHFKDKLSQFKKINFQLISLKELLDKFSIKIDEDGLLNRIGKYNFQSIKKAYAARFFDYNLALIIDSESILIRKTTFKEIFDNFKTNKNKFYAPYIGCDIQVHVTENCFRIMKEPCVYHWLFEYQNWFIYKNIIYELFKYIEELNRQSLYSILLRENPVFEMVLYDIYLKFINNNNHKFISSEDLIKKYLKEKYSLAKERINSYSLTMLECLCYIISNDNVNELSNMFNNNKMNFYRLDSRRSNNLSEQIEFINKTNAIKLLTGIEGNINQEINGVYIK